MKNTHSPRIFGLDVMRATAILCVVVSHALWVFPEAEGSFAALLQLAGVMGVELFFVLSGFLIGSILFKITTGSSSVANDLQYFLIRRWFRTLPNYYFILLINIGIVLFIGRALPDTLGSYFFFFQNFSSSMDIFFTESWSLPIEEFAYLLGPLLLYLVLLWKGSIPATKKFLYVTLAIILFFTLTKMYYHTTATEKTMTLWNINLKAVVLYRIDAIYYGVLAAYISLTSPKIWHKGRIGAAILGMIFFVGMHMGIYLFSITIEEVPFFWNVLYLPLCSICIAFLLPFLSGLVTAPKRLLLPVTAISLWSYSMYLLHYSIVLQLMRYFIPVEGMLFSDKIVFSVGYVCITIGLSYLLYTRFEKPMMDLRDSRYFIKKFKNK